MIAESPHTSADGMRHHLYTARQFLEGDLPVAILRALHPPEMFPPENNVIHKREFWKIVYISHGSGIFKINNHRCRFTPGTVYLSHPDDATTLELTEEIRLYNILFRRDFIASELKRLYSVCNFFEIFSPDFRPENSFTHEGLHFFDANRNIYAQVKRMAHEYEHNDANTAEMLRCQLLELLIELARLSTRTFSGRRRAEIAAIVTDHLRANYRTPVTIQQIADEVGLSRGRLLTLFRNQTGRTIGETLLAIRLDAARRLLTDPAGGTIEEICRLSGFSDLSNFYKFFRRATGMSPGEFRRENSDAVPRHGRTGKL